MADNAGSAFLEVMRNDIVMFRKLGTHLPACIFIVGTMTRYVVKIDSIKARAQKCTFIERRRRPDGRYHSSSTLRVR